MIEYPMMLYKCPGDNLGNDGVSFDFILAKDAASESSLRLEGWMDYADAIADSHQEESEDNAPPTREELEAKCAELGIKFDGRNSDASLIAKIDAVLAEQKV